jgi:hypothetical protein
MSKSRSGGGITSNKVVHRPAPKAEPRSRAVNPAYADQLGRALGNHATNSGKTLKGGAVPMDAGRGYQGPKGPSDNVAAVGVGGGRTVMKSGTQSMHGQPVRSATPPARDILGDFGPEIGGRKR